MSQRTRGPLCAAALLALNALCFAGSPPPPKDAAPVTNPPVVAINQDISFPTPNAVLFYQASGTQLSFQNYVDSGGFGVQGGFFATARVNSVPSLTAPCLYFSNAGSNDISSFTLPGQQQVGVFNASQGDDGSENGIGLAVNANYLYASYTSSNTIATFVLQTGCSLTFLGDVPAVGLQGGSVAGMAVNSKVLVVAYGDGSISSFNIASGLPVSNNDLQNATGYGSSVFLGSTGSTGNLPSGVDITKDGKFAIFGDISSSTMIEVSSLATGKLGKTTVYNGVGTGVSSGAIRLSPDQSLLYIANSEGGTVSAAFFNITTGKVTKGCTSATLRGFNARPWLGSVATRDTTGTGGVLYVTEYGRFHLETNNGPASAVGILSVSSNGVACTLTETSSSPEVLFFPGGLSLGVYPPRPF